MRVALVTAAVLLAAAGVSCTRASHTLADAPDRYFEHGGVRLRYREFGEGEPLLLLHGYAERLELWGPPASHLADSLARNHRVIVMDQRGFGESSKFGDPTRFGRPMADDVVHLMDHLGIRQAHLVGHSMGALVSSATAARHPDRVRTVSLVAGPFYRDSATAAVLFDQVADGLANGEGMMPFFRIFAPELPEHLAAQFSREALAGNDSASMTAVMRALGGVQVGQRVAERAVVPALIVLGTKDMLAPNSRDMASWWPNATLLEVMNADHVTVLERPELRHAIRRHLIDHPLPQ